MMELSLQQIRLITHGAVRVDREDGTVRFHRFTKEQEELYRDKSYPSFYNRTFATAGVTLEFDTDSESLSLSLEVAVSCGYRWFTHSIFVDDQRIGEVAGFIPQDDTPAKAEGMFSLGSGMKRVRIVFPWNEASRLRSLKLDDDAIVLPVQKRRTALIFGDSITQGYTAWLPENSYASRITRWLDADGINKGIGGAGYWPELAQIKDCFAPELVLIAYGANDWRAKTEAEFASEAEEFCLCIRNSYPDAKIIVLTPIWMKTREVHQKDRWPFENLVSCLKALEGKIDGLTVIDGTDLVPWDLACFAEDLAHPNDIGFACYAQALQMRLAEILE